MKTEYSLDDRWELVRVHPNTPNDGLTGSEICEKSTCIREHIYSIYFREQVSVGGCSEARWIADIHTLSLAREAMRLFENMDLAVMVPGEIRPMNEPNGEGNGWETCEADEATGFFVYGETGPLEAFATMAEAEEFLRINEGKIQ